MFTIVTTPSTVEQILSIIDPVIACVDFNFGMGGKFNLGACIVKWTHEVEASSSCGCGNVLSWEYDVVTDCIRFCSGWEILIDSDPNIEWWLIFTSTPEAFYRVTRFAIYKAANMF